MLVYWYKPNATTSSGVWSGNTLKIDGALCRQVYLKPATAATIFDFTITDEDDIVVKSYVGVTKEINDLNPFIVEGVYTLAIAGATADEAFKIKLGFAER